MGLVEGTATRGPPAAALYRSARPGQLLLGGPLSLWSIPTLSHAAGHVCASGPAQDTQDAPRVMPSY